MYIYQGILHEPEYDPENKVLVYVGKSVRNAIWQFDPKLLSVDIICLTWLVSGLCELLGRLFQMIKNRTCK